MFWWFTISQFKRGKSLTQNCLKKIHVFPSRWTRSVKIQCWVPQKHISIRFVHIKYFGGYALLSFYGDTWRMPYYTTLSGGISKWRWMHLFGTHVADEMDSRLLTITTLCSLKLYRNYGLFRSSGGNNMLSNKSLQRTHTLILYLYFSATYIFYRFYHVSTYSCFIIH